MVAFFIWSVQLPQDSTEMIIYINNLEKHGCGKRKYDESFHNAMFINCGLITFHIASMIIFTQRKRIGCQLCANYKLQDGTSLSSNRRVAFYQVCARIITFALLFSVYVLAQKSGDAIEGESSTSIANRFKIMFTTVVFPMIVIAYLLNSGIYDLLVSGIQRWCITEPK